MVDSASFAFHFLLPFFHELELYLANLNYVCVCYFFLNLFNWAFQRIVLKTPRCDWFATLEKAVWNLSVALYFLGLLRADLHIKFLQAAKGGVRTNREECRSWLSKLRCYRGMVLGNNSLRVEKGDGKELKRLTNCN